MTSVLMVLALSANTSFADFPRVCHVLAGDGYLPAEFARRQARPQRGGRVRHVRGAGHRARLQVLARSMEAFRFALTISPEVYVVQVLAEELDTEDLHARWEKDVGEPVRRHLRAEPPRLVVLNRRTGSSSNDW